MPNPYYDHTTFPTPNSPGSSAQLRAELDLIEAGFDKLPTLTGNANKLVVVNAGETGLTTTSSPTGLTLNGAVITTPTITGGTANNVVIGGTTPAAGTFTTLSSASAALTGGTINGVVIGGTTPAAGTFTSLAATSATVGGFNVAVLGNTPQTFAGDVTVSGTLAGTGPVSFGGASINLGTSSSNTSVLLGTGSTTSGLTKTVNIGTNGLSGSTTNITVGSGVAGSTTNIYFNSDGTTAAQLTGGVFSATSPSFSDASLTGVPTAPTAVSGTSTSQIATTAFVTAAAFNAALPGQTGNAGKFVTTDGTNASWAEIPPSNPLPILALGII